MAPPLPPCDTHGMNICLNIHLKMIFQKSYNFTMQKLLSVKEKVIMSDEKSRLHLEVHFEVGKCGRTDMTVQGG